MSTLQKKIKIYLFINGKNQKTKIKTIPPKDQPQTLKLNPNTRIYFYNPLQRWGNRGILSTSVNTLIFAELLGFFSLSFLVNKDRGIYSEMKVM